MNSSSIIEYEKWDHIPNINPTILRGIYNCGFENPSPIQKKAISPIIEKKSIIAQAQSGTGKTCAFTSAKQWIKLSYKFHLPNDPPFHSLSTNRQTQYYYCD